MYIIDDYDLATKILGSNSVEVMPLRDYISKLQNNVNIDLTLLTKFLSHSPFFLEGNEHKIHKRIFKETFGKKNLSYFLPFFEDKIESVTKSLDFSIDIDLIDYCFEIAKKIIRPIIMGENLVLMDDFEKRLYYAQKVAEPLLSIRELVKLEGEVQYLLDTLKKSFEINNTDSKNTMLSYINSENEINLSYDNKLILLLVAYGSMSPFIQTLGNVFFEILSNKEKYFVREKFSEEIFFENLENIIYNSASLLNIYRIVKKDFIIDEKFFKEGTYILIKITNENNISEQNNCNLAKPSLEFGHGAHSCPGAMISKSIIAMVIPIFFAIHKNISIKDWTFEQSIKTAKSLKNLKVEKNEKYK